MVCLSNEGTIQATVKDTTILNLKRQCIVQLSPTKLVDNIFIEVSNQFQYEADSFELILQNQNGDTTILNEHKNKTFGEINNLNLSGRITIILVTLKKKLTLTVSESTDDDLLLGASASPGGEVSSSCVDTSMNLMSVELYCPRNQLSKVESCNYIGLVNQAMTCYLNSLLQALFMTPEFRNALYNWEFDGKNQEKSIPFQLQKLFVNLQTSKKSAVETTDLTHSFGWDMHEAWEQHDIQELCRVMFDALEQTFKNTKQANLINDLYEGKMIDYVKCLECRTEKSREDTFLDIPLPVRPFGCVVAYNSVEEALRAFVQPETLDGNNQYFCEKCNKKCDAHKGLKFVKFPYLLTLHLKRFDFDYSTMHRIKLNDKVVFSEILNLNSFVPVQKNMSVVDDMVEEKENITNKCDDCSTTDSGSALDDESCQGTDVSSTVNGQDENCQDDDEGIDVSSGNHHENDKNRTHEPKGPYIYELFSIMIHSGSASGGHYYAYIKDFKKNHWFCFNDQSVTRITEDDIQKTYGGGPQRGYYSGAYTSSTNAYMLMYRQRDKNRNCNAITVEQFPIHIQKLLLQMQEKEENDRLAKEKENDMFKLKVFCNLPVTNILKDFKVFPFYDNTLAETASEVYEKLDLKGTISLEDCRLVTYNKVQDCIECSFDRDDYKFRDIPVKDYIRHDWYLEIRKPGVPFEVYKPGGVKMKVYNVSIENEEVQGPFSIRINPGETVREVKIRLARMFSPVFDLDVENLKLVLEVYTESTHLDEDDVPIKFEPNCVSYKLYVSSVTQADENDKHYIISKMHKVIDRFVHIINIDIILPDNDIGTLESLSIPPLDLNQNVDKSEMGSGDRLTNSPNLRVSPQPNNVAMEGFGDQSNSEDSSLSDSDRTLVGDAPGDCIGILSSSSNSPADQHMASPSDPTEDTYSDEVFGNPPEEMNWDDETTHCQNYYFKVMCVTTQNKDSIADQDCTRFCRIMVDKRMTIGRLKKHLEIVVGVPTQYFKIYQQYPNQDTELTDMNKNLNTMKDGDKLLIKLGRVLKKNEMSGKIYHLKPDSTEPFTYLFDYIIAKGQTVASVKKDILLQAKKQHMIDIPYNKCRLRKKNWKNPSKIYLDYQKFSEDIPITNKFEMILQDLGEEERLTKSTQMGVFVKRWCPETLTLTPFHEVVLDKPCLEDLKKQLSEESSIPENYLDMAFIKNYFPCDMNILDVQNGLDWNSGISQFDTYLLHGRDDGSVFFYRDNRECMKELTQEEKKEINQRENARLGRNSSKTFSPNRRERGLKIYLDKTQEKKPDDSVAD
ncbi:ubiquitin carboxyl-terminal hydrolase [Holotrichia oblita]|uniref:Ubiquitin carboxyl-terminal hydrolase n=1 Tax=Holotrichia oblita TaxID=644536 RepID=A0ACB9TV64_HOLOL|nr:ubiquitin carboxyl-terminal hydrolase [Holotrichia oblita]